MLNIKIFSKPIQSYIEGTYMEESFHVDIRTIKTFKKNTFEGYDAIYVDYDGMQDIGDKVYILMDSGSENIDAVNELWKNYPFVSCCLVHSFYVTDNSGKTVYYEE